MDMELAVNLSLTSEHERRMAMQTEEESERKAEEVIRTEEYRGRIERTAGEVFRTEEYRGCIERKAGEVTRTEMCLGVVCVIPGGARLGNFCVD